MVLCIAKAGKPHDTAETLLLPAAKDMRCVMMGEAPAAKLNVTITSIAAPWHLM